MLTWAGALQKLLRTFLALRAGPTFTADEGVLGATVMLEMLSKLARSTAACLAPRTMIRLDGISGTLSVAGTGGPPKWTR